MLKLTGKQKDMIKETSETLNKERREASRVEPAATGKKP